MEEVGAGLGQCSNGIDAVPAQLPGGGRAHIQQVAHRQGPHQLPVVLPGNDRGGIWLPIVAAQLGKDLVEGDSHRHRQAQLSLDPPPQGVRDLLPISEQAGAATHVQPALVQSKGLHLVGVLEVELPHLMGELQIAIIPGRHYYQTRTAAPGLPDSLPGGHAKGFGLIALGQDDAMAQGGIPAHRHRLPPQSGVVQALRAGIKVVQIAVQNHSLHRIAPRTFVLLLV